MSNDLKENLPWFSPDECVEACELLADIREMLLGIADFAPLRKELRVQLADKARSCTEFLDRTSRPRIERAVILAMDVLADKRKIKTSALLAEAVETFVSKVNRSA